MRKALTMVLSIIFHKNVSGRMKLNRKGVFQGSIQVFHVHVFDNVQ